LTKKALRVTIYLIRVTLYRATSIDIRNTKGATMPRLTPQQWERARAEYEVKGVSLGDISRRYRVDIGGVSRRAKKDGWCQGKNQGLVERKARAVKEIVAVEKESQALPLTFQQALDAAVKSRLELDGLLLDFDRALIAKGLEILTKTDSPEKWETMTRGKRNLAP
jgi:hypothetical protein